MMLESADKSYLAKWFVGTALVATAVSVSLLSRGIYHFTGAGGPSGDTPVVLVGGSMTFKPGVKNITWVPTGNDNKAFSIAANYPIMSIAVKSKAGPDPDDNPVDDDRDPSTDLIRLDVSAASTWTVDEYTSTEKAATLSPDPGSLEQIDLTVQGSGTLSRKGKKLVYCSDANCSVKPDFDHVVITVTGANGQIQSTASLDCVDKNTTKGTCRIAFRGPVK
jgi:hypothetical protein